ncbi:MAG: orotidine 5'-phosphate decarboxylase / HUMPS family protein [Candidatus Hadarchaeota archaeon]
MEFGGYMGRILRVNFSEKTCESEELDPKLAYNFLGGRGYAAKVLYDELNAETDPLGPENKLIFMTGPLTGTTFPGAGRISISSKSPLTGTIFDCSMGGSFGVYLKKGGYDGIIVEGSSEEPVYLLIDDGEAEIRKANEIWGSKTSEAEKALVSQYEDSRAVTIGPAGERLSKLACLTSETRMAGRGGLGAVMGSKKLKGIVSRGKNSVKPSNENEFNRLLSRIRETISTHPITGKDGSLARFGTALLVHRIRAADMLPKSNFSGESLDFEEVDQFSGETVNEKYLVDQKACFACPTGCGRIVEADGERKKGPEFESVAMLGPNSEFYDFEDEILPLAELCDELGLDSISVGNALGFAREHGRVSSYDEAKELIKDIAKNKSAFSEGVVQAAKELGKEEEAAHVKGLELPAYDPRGAKGIALAYATSNRGGCHLRAFTIIPEILSNPEFIDPAIESKKPELVRKMQDAYAIYDSLIACKFHSLALFSTLNFELNDIAKLTSALTGFEITNEKLHEIGSRIYNLERLFNMREGLDRADDQLPKKFDIDVENMLKEYYEERGWDKNGTPKKVEMEEPKRVSGIERSLHPLERIELPQVQVALDIDADIESICNIAERAYKGGARIIEAGTPAIKRHGVDSLIPPLKERVEDAVIVADLKTMDVGDLEARIAFRAGADIAAVLAIGGKAKIFEALSEAIRHDKMILIDFIDCENPLERIAELKKEMKGKEDRVIFCLHRGISEQLKSRGIYEKKELLSKAREYAGDFKLAVAGGIKEGVAKNVAEAGTDICVVGSSIYNSSDPKKTTQNLMKEMRNHYNKNE